VGIVKLVAPELTLSVLPPLASTSPGPFKPLIDPPSA
jgi:hypothetical protein